jgi:hypothetical protein
MRTFGIVLMLLMFGVAIGAEAPDFTMRDRDGKVVKWSIVNNDDPSKGYCPTDLFKGTEAVMTKFGLKELKLLPMCGETVSFFADKGTLDGKTYTLEGAEYHGPWGDRCAYAQAVDADGQPAPKDVELVLHLMGKFRYCLWGGDWMCRKTYTYKGVEAAPGESIIDGTKLVARVKELVATGIGEDQAYNRALLEPGCRKQTTGRWGSGSTVKPVLLPLPASIDRVDLVTGPDHTSFFAVYRSREVRAKATEIRMVSQDRVAEKQMTSDCSTCRVDRSQLTPQALRAAGIMKPEESLAKVLFREQETSSSDTVLMEGQEVPIVVTKDVVETIVTVTTYPITY